MSSFALDTNHVSAIFKQDQRIISRIERTTQLELGSTMPSVGEMWFMVLNSDRIRANTARFESILQSFRIWDYDVAAANEFGRIKAELRRMGRPISDVDVQIAAIARLNGLTLLTSDKHFNAVPNLAAEDWLA